MNGVIEWVIFLSLSAIAVTAAASMILTMSMYRAGLALMASFVALAGLFILLNADLLAAIQVMMNVGGMLVMVLFMVMMMMDPGGEMMWGMKQDMHIPGPAAFSMTMPRGKPPEEDTAGDKKQQDTSTITDWTCLMHAEISQGDAGTCPKCGMALLPRAQMANGDTSQAPASHEYTCPMHKELQQDQPGTCPTCGMTLIPATGQQTRDQTASAHIYTCPMHPEVRENQHGKCPQCGMTLIPATNSMQEQASDGQHALLMSMEHAHNDESVHSSDQEMSMRGMAMGKRNGHEMQLSGGKMDKHAGMTPRQYYDMMVGMAMSTAQLPWAIVLGAIAALLLVILVIQTPWTLAPGGPTQDATTMVGELLLSRYMIGFEGAAFLILAGIAGAVILGKREGKPAEQPSIKPDETSTRDEQVFTCPMHPEVKQERPGTCPTCGMTLIPAKGALASGETGKQGEHR